MWDKSHILQLISVRNIWPSLRANVLVGHGHVGHDWLSQSTSPSPRWSRPRWSRLVPQATTPSWLWYRLLQTKQENSSQKTSLIGERAHLVYKPLIRCPYNRCRTSLIPCNWFQSVTRGCGLCKGTRQRKQHQIDKWSLYLLKTPKFKRIHSNPPPGMRVEAWGWRMPFNCGEAFPLDAKIKEH